MSFFYFGSSSRQEVESALNDSMQIAIDGFDDRIREQIHNGQVIYFINVHVRNTVEKV